ncbi:MAG: HAD family hydrolase [Bacteroidota bacterium]|nr:HAD family hydrolase [Bacteroidota bacterium]
MITAQNDFAVFVDRDGTINVDVDFLTSPSQLQLIPRSAEAIKELNDLGIPVIVITNQSGIARGLISENDLHHIHSKMDEMLQHFGASISAYYYCPHHPDGTIAQYVVDCDCRKPKPGMLYTAKNDFGFDLQRSFVVGDKFRDVEAGNVVGAVAIQVSTGYGAMEKDLCKDIRDFYAVDLFDAVQFIKLKLKQ